MRKQAGLWLAVGVVACVAGWGIRDGFDRPDVTSETPATKRASATLLRVQGDLATVGKPAAIALDAEMVRHALRDGELQVALPNGTTYPVAMERQETDRFGQWTVVGRVRTQVNDAAMVLTFGGNAVFGIVPMPDGRMLQVTTNHGRVESMLAGGMTPPGLRAVASDVATVPVTRGAPFMRTRDGTADSGTDYVGAGGVVTFAEGESWKQVAVEVLGDNAPEPDESFEVVLVWANVAIQAGVDRVDILEDEPTTGGPAQKEAVQ